MNILILGASYGSLLSTKLLMAGHDVALVCRAQTAQLINDAGTTVRIKLRDEDTHRSIQSMHLPGSLVALTPDSVDLSGYDMVALAMSEPQYGVGEVKTLMARIASSGKPCLSIMNMPPLPYLQRIPSLAEADLSSAYTDFSVWDGFDPGLVNLCSPDPQAFRPPEEAGNVLHVGLPTNFKAATFASSEHTDMLRQLESDIAGVTLDEKDVPVKLRVFDSLFVPMAKWSMLLAGNYRCVTSSDALSIQEAVHGDIDESRAIYQWVGSVAQKLGANPEDQVPFEKYANAAKSLQKPSSAARAIYSGTKDIERVDKLVQLVANQIGMQSDEVDRVVAIVDERLMANRQQKAS